MGKECLDPAHLCAGIDDLERFDTANSPPPAPSIDHAEQDLANRLSPQAIEAAIREHRGLVERVARGLYARSPWVDLDDLVQCGLIGLFRCLQQYRTNCGASVITFAYARIHGAMVDELRSQGGASRATADLARRMNSTTQRLQHRLLRRPSHGEMAREMQIPLEDYLGAQRDLAYTGPLKRTTLSFYGEADEGESTVDDLIDEASDPALRCQALEVYREAMTCFNSLPERDRLVYQGVLDGESGVDIADRLGLTKSRVSQIKGQVVAALEAHLL